MVNSKREFHCGITLINSFEIFNTFRNWEYKNYTKHIVKVTGLTRIRARYVPQTIEMNYCLYILFHLGFEHLIYHGLRYWRLYNFLTLRYVKSIWNRHNREQAGVRKVKFKTLFCIGTRRGIQLHASAVLLYIIFNLKNILCHHQESRRV